MLNFRKSVLFVFGGLAILVFVSPFLVQAADDISIWPLGYWGPLVACGGDTCTSLCDLIELGQRLTAFGISLVVFAIGPIMLVYGGMKLLMSGGSEERIKSGRKTVTDAVIGIAVALGTWLILTTFLWGLGIATGGNAGVQWPNIECTVQAP